MDRWSICIVECITASDPNCHQTSFWSDLNVEACRLESQRRAWATLRTELLLAKDAG